MEKEKGFVARGLLSCGWRQSRVERCVMVTVLVISLLSTSCARAPQRRELLSSSAGWREFQGTWNAAGNRSVMQLGDDRRASISDLSGSLLLSGRSRPAVGFRAEAIVFTDTLSGTIGRAVWTDDHGDQAFSELRGQGTRTDNKVVGAFTGGTGRYAGISGEYEFSWRFLLESVEGEVQGQSFGLVGRVRLDAAHSADTGGKEPR